MGLIKTLQGLMGSYEKLFAKGPELAVLRLLSLFDGPAEGQAIAALRSPPPIPGLTDALQGLSEADWQGVVERLRRAGLLAKDTSSQPDKLDAHPVVREYFGRQLRKAHPEAWEEGRKRLAAILEAIAWPPKDPVGFVHGSQFQEMLDELGGQLHQQYPASDFKDAEGRVLDWFKRRAAKEPDFINLQRFRSRSAFRGYLSQAILNAARLAETDRQHHERVKSLPVDRPIAPGELTGDERADLTEMVEALPLPHKLIFKLHFFAEEPMSAIAARYGWAPADVQKVYLEALDVLNRQDRS